MENKNVSSLENQKDLNDEFKEMGVKRPIDPVSEIIFESGVSSLDKKVDADFTEKLTELILQGQDQLNKLVEPRDKVDALTLQEQMRIFFVGVHNKVGMEPLDSKTKSGKMIDRVITGLQTEVGLFEAEFIKTNLFHPTITWFPKGFDPEAEVFNWKNRNRVNDADIVISLGHIVNEAFRKAKVPSIKIGHPSGVWSKLKQEEYIINAAIKVSEYIQQSKPEFKP